MSEKRLPAIVFTATLLTLYFSGYFVLGRFETLKYVVATTTLPHRTTVSADGITTVSFASELSRSVHVEHSRKFPLRAAAIAYKPLARLESMIRQETVSVHSGN